MACDARARVARRYTHARGSGQWSEADEYRLQLANRELVDWGPQTPLAMLGLARFPPPNALGAAGGGKMVQPDLPPQHAPNFIVSPSGTTFPVPAGAVGPSAVRTKKGVQYEGGSGGYGFDPRTTGLRVMDPVLTGRYQYPTGYGVYMNRHEQTVNPFTGRTLRKGDPYSHIKR